MVYTAVYHINHDPRTSRGTIRINTGAYNYPEHDLIIACYLARTDLQDTTGTIPRALSLQSEGTITSPRW